MAGKHPAYAIGPVVRVSSSGGRELGKASLPPSLRSGSGGPAVRPSPYRHSSPTSPPAAVPGPAAAPVPAARSSQPPMGRVRSRVTVAAVTVSALAASLAGCVSVSDAPRPKPSGTTARHDGKGAESGPGGVTVDGRGDGPRRMGRNGAAQPAGGDEEGEPSAEAKPTSSAPATPSRPVKPSGPEPDAGGGHGGDDHGDRPGTPHPSPSRPDRPSSPPTSAPPSTPTAPPTPPPSSPAPPPSTQASGPSPVSPMSSQAEPGVEQGA